MYGIRHFSSSHGRQFMKKFSKYVVQTTPGEYMAQELIRPVGLVAAPVATTKYSEGNSFKDMFDKDKTEKRAQELGMEFNKSSFYEMAVFRKTNGKMFYSPKSYWQAEKSLYFPHVYGVPLTGSVKIVESILKGKTSVIKLFSNATGSSMVDSYFKNDALKLDYMKKDYEALEKTNSQIVQLNLIESGAKEFLYRWFAMGKIKKEIQENLQDKYFVCNRNQLPFMLRDHLQINNVYTGYVIVVDRNLKIRWMGSGAASEDEFKTLWKCVRGISKEP